MTLDKNELMLKALRNQALNIDQNFEDVIDFLRAKYEVKVGRAEVRKFYENLIAEKRVFKVMVGDYIGDERIELVEDNDMYYHSEVVILDTDKANKMLSLLKYHNEFLAFRDEMLKEADAYISK